VVEKRVKIAIDLILNSAIEEWQKQGGGETHLEPTSVHKPSETQAKRERQLYVAELASPPFRLDLGLIFSAAMQ
jgi:hypothetical protein